MWKKSGIITIVSILLWGMFSFYAWGDVPGIKTYAESYLPRAHVGVVVLNRDNGKVLYRYHALKYFTPASSSKLFVLASVLKYIPENFRYETIISYDEKHVKKGVLKGDLMVSFSGDPSLRTRDLERLVERLPFKSITGHIIINNDSHFIGKSTPSGRPFGDDPWYYAAKTTGIALDRNSFPVYIKADHIGKPAVFQYDDIGVDVKNETVVGTGGGCGVSIYQNALHNQLLVTGCIPARAHGEIVWRFALPSNVDYVEYVLKKLLKKHHIKFPKETFEEHFAAKNFSHKIIHQSEKIAIVAQRMGRYSDDFYAESLLKTLGHLKVGSGSFGGGVLAMKEYLFSQLGIRSDMIQLSDGEGTRYDMATPMQIAQLLYAVAHDPQIKKPFLNALSESGGDGFGTLHLRMGLLRYKGTHFYGKTGTLMNVSSLSGYLDVGDKHYIVVVISNNFLPHDESKVKQMESNIIQWIAQNPAY